MQSTFASQNQMNQKARTPVPCTGFHDLSPLSRTVETMTINKYHYHSTASNHTIRIIVST